jgi:hypothetical protein
MMGHAETYRHSLVPAKALRPLIPAFAGMTNDLLTFPYSFRVSLWNLIGYRPLAARKTG